MRKSQVEENYGRVGFYLAGGAAVGIENSDDFDEASDVLQIIMDALIEDEIDDGDLPPGTTGTAKLDIEVSRASISRAAIDSRRGWR